MKKMLSWIVVFAFAVLCSSTVPLHAEITAFAGTIGGWTIAASQLTATNDTVGLSSATTGGDDVRFWAGSAPRSACSRVVLL